jgi:hypothetical protein
MYFMPYYFLKKRGVSGIRLFLTSDTIFSAVSGIMGKSIEPIRSSRAINSWISFVAAALSVFIFLKGSLSCTILSVFDMSSHTACAD